MGKSVVEGKQWESIFERSALRLGITCTRFPDGCRVVGKNKLIRVKTPLDFILTHNKMAAFLDCKSYDSDQISHSMIKDHQLQSLLQFESDGFAAGYIIWFRKSDVICFAKASQLVKIEPNSSLHGREMIILGQLDNFTLGRLFTLPMEASEWMLTS